MLAFCTPGDCGPIRKCLHAVCVDSVYKDSEKQSCRVELRIQKTRLTNAGVGNIQRAETVSVRLVGLPGVECKTRGSTSSQQWVCC